ncbi:hypothetical protein H0I23_13000 [Cellulophaga sp. HaHaR_3_176]|uniref:hypothetical protein n=1 Tax=Cellulophaga sp. HaHaR_3_176 TaxID=1942464 RepID=UPI001C1F2A37|nr:hypothetical protein [Cellulophaga sp. HaHaR_3_176]QWX83364.1 hypothetical protein H0I23_13000 [Cellulophaga sp. HaHaR_3_176]
MARIYILFIFLGFFSCKNNKTQEKSIEPQISEVISENYELYKPLKQAKAVLILFGGYPENIEDIKREFKILEVSKENDIAVLYLNYNKKLWLEENEKHLLAEMLQEIIKENKLPNDAIFIGGFSSGGVVSLSISNYILSMDQFNINPKGVFIIDSPIDLAALYYSSEKNIERDFSKTAIQESNWIIKTLENAFGNPNDSLSNYENKSLFTYKSNHTLNLQNLKNTKIRLYTEPDTIWWKKNRMAGFDQTNAYYIKNLEVSLKEQKFKNVEYIATNNKGYRANGERHPHSWSIVDKKDLINWILEK